MNVKTSTVLLTALSLIGTGVGYILTNSIKFGLCIANEVVTEASCINFYERIGNASFFGMGALALVFLALTFFPKAWGAWKKFAVWYVPIAALIFIFYKDPGSMNLISPYAETVFMWLGGIYVIVSCLIIGLAASKKA